MSTLEHLMGVTSTTSRCPSCFWKKPYFLKWDPNKAFSGLEEKYLQPHLFNSALNDSKIKEQRIEYPPHKVFLSDKFHYGGKTTFWTNCFVWWVTFIVAQTVTQSYFQLGSQSGPWRIRRRSSGHVCNLSRLKLTILNRCYGRVAGSYPRNCIRAAHGTSCCPVYHVSVTVIVGVHKHARFISYKLKSKMSVTTRLKVCSNASSSVRVYTMLTSAH